MQLPQFDLLWGNCLRSIDTGCISCTDKGSSASGFIRDRCIPGSLQSPCSGVTLAIFTRPVLLIIVIEIMLPNEQFLSYDFTVINYPANFMINQDRMKGHGNPMVSNYGHPLDQHSARRATSN